VATRIISINRAPVLTLWAAVVAERLGFDRDEALTLGRAVAGLNAQSKGRRLGIFKPHEATKAKDLKTEKGKQRIKVELLGRAVPTSNAPGGIRAVSSGKPIEPSAVEDYLADKFGDDLTVGSHGKGTLKVLDGGVLFTNGDASIGDQVVANIQAATITASTIPWISFFSTGQIVARTPPRTAFSPWTK
jgi:hypothetical protein